MIPKLRQTLIAAGSLFVLLIGCAHRSETPKIILPGENWMRMDSSGREHYIGGYIQGYATAAYETCNFVEDDFDLSNPVLLEQASRLHERPSEICLSRTMKYSKDHIDENGITTYTFYADVITAFYEQHKDYKNLPPTLLLTHLSDGHDETATQLYEDAKRRTF